MPRSSTRKRPPETVFFVDRNLGRLFVAHLRAEGLRVEAHDDHFLPTTQDVDWLPVVGARGWVAVTHDQLRARPEEQEQLMLHGVKTFVLVGRATHAEMAACFLGRVRRIQQLIEASEGPFLAKILVASGEVRISLTLEEWFARQARRRR